jgi:ribosomal-protein-alanine N-acetyltransferase
LPTNAPFRIEVMKEDDVQAVAAIAGPTHMDAAHVRDEMQRPWSRLWVAREEDGPVVAYLVAWHVADELHVLNIATAPAMRRRGLARALMAEALVYAAAQRIRIVLLEVRRSNRPAIKLYRGLGFTALGVRPGYYSDNDEDAIEMILSLDPSTGRLLPGRDEIRIDG